MTTFKTSQFVQAMQRIAPLEMAEPWDNVGLLAGDPEAEVNRVLLTIDCTNEVLQEAVATGVDAIVAYHPPIFKPLKNLVSPSIAYRLARTGIALYSPHTALDCAAGGTNDALADALNMRARKPLLPRKIGSGEAVKLVTFVPEQNVERVCDALFAIGAGRVGAYGECSFRSAGTGTFFGEEVTSPAVGQKLRRERVAEDRVEVLVPHSLVPQAIAALRASHPYQEPAFDLVMLAPGPAAQTTNVGMGRIGDVEGSVATMVTRVRTAIGLDALLVAGPSERDVKVSTRVAVLAGSAGEHLMTAIDRGAEVIVTGEVHHHDALAAVARGVTLICTLHSNSERLVLPGLRARLATALDGIDVHLSTADRDPFRFAVSQTPVMSAPTVTPPSSTDDSS